MTAQAVQTKEHDEKQDDVSGKFGNGAEFDAVQLHITAIDYVHCV